MKKDLSDLVDKYWKDFQGKRSYECVYKPSVPIIWFGDLEAYKKSKWKIVTVGLNPSDAEFNNSIYPRRKSNQKSFWRFPLSEKLWEKQMLNPEDKERFVKSLNDYFRKEPYGWFNVSEKLLNVLNASFYTKTEYENTAIHIDIYTAIATFPTWSKLNKEDQDDLMNTGLFEELLLFLEPNIILISCNKKTFADNFADYKLAWTYVKKNKYEWERKEKCEDKKAMEIQKYSNGFTHLIKGIYRGNVFQNFTDSLKREIFLDIKKSIMEDNDE